MSNPMSTFFGDLVAAGKKVEDFLISVVKGAKTLSAIWGALSGPVLAAASAVFYDVVKTVNAAESAAASAQSGNVVSAITLSETTISLVKQVVSDFKAGEATIVSDFKALGIKL
ncbi:MAG TPA: hypothetical protein VM554_15120 [Acidisarcina sp.]|nr:hypothetical protein [Acidisarcina sp.]